MDQVNNLFTPKRKKDGTIKLDIAVADFDDLDVYVGATDALDLFKATVEAYIAQDAEKNAPVLLAVVADAKSTVEETVIAADVDFVSYVDTSSPDEFKYINDSDKEVIIDVADTPDVYFNGQKMHHDDIARAVADIVEKSIGGAIHNLKISI